MGCHLGKSGIKSLFSIQRLIESLHACIYRRNARLDSRSAALQGLQLLLLLPGGQGPVHLPQSVSDRSGAVLQFFHLLGRSLSVFVRSGHGLADSGNRLCIVRDSLRIACQGLLRILFQLGSISCNSIQGQILSRGSGIFELVCLVRSLFSFCGCRLRGCRHLTGGGVYVLRGI